MEFNIDLTVILMLLTNSKSGDRIMDIYVTIANTLGDMDSYHKIMNCLIGDPYLINAEGATKIERAKQEIISQHPVLAYATYDAQVYSDFIDFTNCWKKILGNELVIKRIPNLETREPGTYKF